MPVFIDYEFGTRCSSTTGNGVLAGAHDGYPSDIVQKDGQVVCDFEQGWILELAESSDVSVYVEF